uniref:Lipocalin domain-containing protein n=1 Tax=Onchocerca volvulus TaxID=6282 RepID=A0A2K6VL39_ONCVO
MLHHTFIILFLFFPKFSYTVKYLGGIPVPGRSVPPIRIFELYAKSCKPNDRTSAVITEQLSNLLQKIDASDIASNLYNSLYMAVGDINIIKLMGKWFMVVDTPSVHHEYCPIFYFELLDKTLYTATFTVRQYSRNTEKIKILEGYGRKMGPDPAELLINIGHPADPCPYSIVRSGPINHNEQYDYIILTQPLKYPIMVLARDPIDFENKYKEEVKTFLGNQRFWHSSFSLKNTVLFLNTTDCFRTNQYNIGF